MFKKNALISVFDKTGIETFAQGLVGLGWKIISSGGTAKYLSDCGITVTDVAEITGVPAVLGHRVVTLAPQIHGGLLAPEEKSHELEALGWPWIDLLCVDMYPLEKVLDNPNATRQQLIDKTDIGGPTMIRAAVKGGRIVVTTQRSRAEVLRILQKGEEVNRDLYGYAAEEHVYAYIGNSALARKRILHGNHT